MKGFKVFLLTALLSCMTLEEHSRMTLQEANPRVSKVKTYEWCRLGNGLASELRLVERVYVDGREVEKPIDHTTLYPQPYRGNGGSPWIYYNSLSNPAVYREMERFDLERGTYVIDLFR